MQRWKRALAIVIGTGFVVATAASVGGQSDKAASEKAIVAAEQKINEAVAKGDLGAFKDLVDKDCVMVSPDGVSSVSEFEKNFKQVKLESGWKITDTKVTWAASNTAILTYKWTGKGTYMGQPLPSVAFASTVWHRNGTKWTAMFHQETPAASGK